jgi:tetratricopeptide (TPR) repeat protein
VSNQIFISHATADDAVVKELREALEARGVAVWADSRELSGGEPLEKRILKAIEQAPQFLVVLGPKTANSPWVQEEVQHARKIAESRTDGYKLIPLMLPGVEPAALKLWFGEEPIGIKLTDGPGRIQKALPEIFAALGRALPDDPQPAQTKDATPVADLILELSEPAIVENNGVRRATAKAVLIYDPPESNAEAVRSQRFVFTAPLGVIEAGELAWYLEGYPRWPATEGVFADRAKAVVDALPKWGKQLYDAAIAPAVTRDAGRNAFSAWNRTGANTERRFSVLVDENFLADPALGDEANAAKEAQAKEAAALLLSLPWELAHDDRDYLFQGARGVRVRRRLPNQITKDPLTTTAPLRVLLVSPRPEQDDHDARVAYIDHRVSARPLVESLSALGDLARLTILNPPTFPALQTELQRARDAGQPYHVVHFDGHGVFDRPRRDGLGGHHGLGALVFEHPDDTARLEHRRCELVDAQRLAGIIRDHRVPLFFLEACQSAQAEQDPTSSVAGRLLQGGVASVAAMSHSVLVETARRFISVFYQKLLSGERVGQAMLAAQQALKADPRRGKAFTGELKMEDWFVPVLFQEETDPQLIRETPSARVREEIQKARQLALGRLPDPPKHTFVGRSRELLRAERLLCRDGDAAARYVVLRGEGGEGKTALGCELARWLVASQRFDRTAFVSLEQISDARAVLWAIGEQLVPGFLSRAGQEQNKAEQFVERALRDNPTLIVVDNCESVLPPVHFGSSRREEAREKDEGRRMNDEASQSLLTSAATESFDSKLLSDLLALCQRLSVMGGTRLIFTTRTPLPEPFGQHHLTIDRLDRTEAIELVGKVLGEDERMPRAASDVENEQQIEDLVEAVNCHARSLVLVARELIEHRLPPTTVAIRQIMQALHQKHGDKLNARELSLFASVELSLRRLPKELRQLLPPLAVFQGGGHMANIAHLLSAIGYLPPDEKAQQAVIVLARALVQVGLAELPPYGYLRLDPALGPALERELSAPQRQVAEAAWADAMSQLTSFLYQQQFKDPHFAATLTLLELPNLRAALEFRFNAASHASRIKDHSSISWDSIVGMATSLEGLPQNLGRPKVLARVAALREQVAAQLGEWSHARFLAESAAINRLLDAGRAAEAVPAARNLLARAEAAGESAYTGADYDLAMCHFRLGRGLKKSGDPQSALTPLAEARARFQKLADAGNENAARMASGSLTERADCLTALRQLDQAAAAYEEALKLGEKRGDLRDVATGKGQLGTVRMLQRRYGDALAAYTEARETFERLGEPGSVATAWHQIGMVSQEAGQYEAAERAYQEALRMKVQHGDRPAEASTLGQLGNLYSKLGRPEDAVRFYRQVADIYAAREVADHAKEGIVRNNIAGELLKLGRHDEARREIRRAIECKKPFGHAATIWNVYNILTNIERAVGNAPAATEARDQALAAYLAYRRDGGEPIGRGIGVKLCTAVARAIADSHPAQAAAELAKLAKKPDLQDYARRLLPALQSILSGSRDRALAADPNLRYSDAAELHLLLDRLGVAP